MPAARRVVARLVSTLTALSLAGGLAAPAGAAALPAALPAAPSATNLPWPLVVTEMAPDNSGADHFEFFEVANTSDEPIDLAAGYTFTYIYTNEGTSSSDKPLTITEETATVPAHGSAVFWLQYTSGSTDSFARSDDEFRAAVGAAADVPLFHVTGQPGMANSASRGIRVDDPDGEAVSWSVYDRTAKAPDTSTHFAVPADVESSAMVELPMGPHTPGAVDPAQLTATEPEPEPAPTVPDQGPPPPSDPDLKAPALQVTEVAPDTTNVGSADGYEFIELYNASDAPVPFAEHTINYLYLDASHVVTNSTVWAASPADPVIEPGRTLVLWVKNGPNDDLTAADFNEHFGSSLTAGEDLIEISSGGMANGGPRGIQVETNTGHPVSRADYMNNEQTIPDQPIQFRWEDGTAQTLVGPDVATPGYASPDQVPASLVVAPQDTEAPVVSDRTEAGDVAASDGLDLLFDIIDNRRVSTVELSLADDVGEPSTRSLRFEETDADRYAYEVPAVDMYGKAWVEYTLEVSDGSSTTTLGPVRVDLVDGESGPVRLNVTDGQFVAGETRVALSTSGDPAGSTLAVDGVDVDVDVDALTPSLAGPALYAFEATSTDAFFRNGVKLGDDVLTVFDEGTYELRETVTSEVPVDRIAPGRSVTLGIYAGTKAWPEPNLDENNDDFTAFDPRLALPDGRVLRPQTCAGAGEGQDETARDCPEQGERIGFSDADQVYFTTTFAVPDDAFDSLAHTWDTTAVDDGEHAVTATSGAGGVTRTVVVDNTAPQITTDLADGETYRGDLELDADATDAGSGVESLVATLDGETVELPHETSSLELAPGEHTWELTAKDEVGNTGTRSLTFSTPDETPTVTLGEPADDAAVDPGDVALFATSDSATGDALDVEFRAGYAFDTTDPELSASAGTTTVATGMDRDSASAYSQADLVRMAGTDGVSAEVSSDTEFPYQLFTLDVPDSAGADGRVRVAWSGAADADAKVLLYVLDTVDETWREIDRYVTTDGAATEFELGGTVPLADHTRDGEVTVLVQHSEGFAGTARSERDDETALFHPGATARSEYDFTIGWESDTQYYNDNEGQPANGGPDEWFVHQDAIHDFFLDQRDELNLQYLVHTGDIVDDWDQEYQWRNADPSYRTLDEAGLPYGVLAGNHDVGGGLADYTKYSEYFGADRFADNPWYGGQHQDNRGHYDLVSADGVDLLLLYMGWAPGDDQIAWMNEVIAAHPERKVWLNLHEYMLTTGGLGPVPQRILDEVVAPNPNVVLVSSGHYHDAYTRTDEFDDTGDGVPDRTVYSMLFDYQGLPEGGLGYLRLLHFDNEGGADGAGRIVVRTYSPSLDVFNSDDPALNSPAGMQDFEIPYAALGIDPAPKALATDSIRIEVLTPEVIATADAVVSGEEASGTWSGVEPGEHGWYVQVIGSHGGEVSSPVREFTAGPASDSAWQEGRVYDDGDEVTYEGSVFRALWWTTTAPGDSPWGAWEEIATAEDGADRWTASRIFTAGDVVVHDGSSYEARWWTRNQEPGPKRHGPWEVVDAE